MSNRNDGLYKKYEVTKLRNPGKKIDAIVLEFDDPISRSIIRQYAFRMLDAKFTTFGNELLEKIDRLEKEENAYCNKCYEDKADCLHRLVSHTCQCPIIKNWRQDA